MTSPALDSETLFDGVPVGLFRLSPHGELITTNRALAEILGYPDQETLLRSGAPELFTQLAGGRQGEFQNAERQVTKPDGSDAWVRLSMREMRAPDGTVMHYEGSVENITEHKRVSEALARSEYLNKSIITNINEGVVVYDRLLRYVTWNKYMEELTGLKAEEVLGKVAIAVFPIFHQETTNTILLRALRGETLTSSDIPFYTADSKKTGWLVGTFGPLVDSHGESIGVIATLRDITQRKEADLERERMLAAEQRRTRELNALMTAATAISTSLNLDEILTIVCQQLTQLLDVQDCAISDWDAEEGLVKLRTRYSIEGYEVKPEMYAPYRVSDWPKTENVILNRQPEQLQIDDPELYDIGRRYLEKAGLSTLLMLPLVSQNKTIGLVELEDRRAPRTFTDEEIALAQTLCNQAAVNIENARLFEETQRQLTELRILHSVATMSADAVNQDVLIEHATNLFAEHFFIDNFGVLLLDEVEGVLRQHPSYLASPITLQVPILIGQGITGTVTKTGKAIRSGNVAESSEYLDFDPKTRSELCAPIKIGRRVIGVVNAESYRLNAFSESDERLLATFAGQLATAIEHNRAQAARQRHTEQLRILNELARDMTGLVDAAQICNLVVNRLVSSLGHYNASIFLLETGSDELTLQAISKPYNERTIPGYRVPISSGILGKTAASGEIIIANDVSKEPVFVPVEGSNILSEIAIPLRVDGRVSGVLNVDSSERGSFDDTEVAALSTLADQLALALEKARLFQTEREQRAQAETLREVAVILSSATDKATVLDFVLQQLNQVVRYDSAALHILHGDEMFVEAVAGSLPPELILGHRFTVAENKVVHPMLYQLETRMYADVREHPGWITAPGSEHIISWIGAPLIAGGQCIGVLTVDGHRHSQFSQADAQLVSTFANHAAQAIETARLFGETNEALERETLLNEFTRAISASLSVNEILEKITALAAELVGAETGSIILFDEASETATHLYFHNRPESVRLEVPTKGRGVLWEVLESGKAQMLADYSKHPMALPEWTEAGVHAALIVPIPVGDTVLGVLGVLSISPSKQFTLRELELVESLCRQAGIAVQNAKLYDELESAYVQTVLALANTMDARDSYTSDHSQRLVIWADLIGREMKADEEELESIRWAALLHDIGKIGVPDEILLKPQTLNESETALMRRHPNIGAGIVAPVKKLAKVAPIIRAHQEWFDGTGYPDHLKGDQIPKGARILAVVDAYQAITDNRVYRPARSHREAVKELREWSGKQFDPDAVDIFLRVLERERRKAEKPKAKSRRKKSERKRKNP